MINVRHLAMCSALLLAACGGGSRDTASASSPPPPPLPPPPPTIALTPSATSMMHNGSSVEITATLTGVTGPVTWSATPKSPIGDTLYALPDNPIAIYGGPGDPAVDKVTITASAGGISNSIQLNVKPAPVPVPWVTLPVTWEVAFGDPPYLTGPRPVDSVADQSGNLYVAYSSPVSEIKKVATDGSLTTYARVGKPTSLAVGPGGVLYVVDALGAYEFAIRRIAADGTISTLTQTAPYDASIGTIDGAARVATAYQLNIAVAPDGTVYATDGFKIRKIAPDGALSTFAGRGCEAGTPLGSTCASQLNPVDGVGTQAQFMNPDEIVTDKDGNLYVSDALLVRKVTPAGKVTTLAGRTKTNFNAFTDIDGMGGAAFIDGNGPMTIDAAGNLYKLSSRGLMRKITPSGVTTTVANTPRMTGAQPQFGVASISAGAPGVVILQSYAGLSKVKVD